MAKRRKQNKHPSQRKTELCLLGFSQSGFAWATLHMKTQTTHLAQVYTEVLTRTTTLNAEQTQARAALLLYISAVDLLQCAGLSGKEKHNNFTSNLPNVR